MPTNATIPMRTPGELAAAAPYLLGFTPNKSIIVAALTKNGSEFESALTMRISIPETMQDLDEALDDFNRALAHADTATHALIICVDDINPAPMCDMPYRDYIDRVSDVLAANNLRTVGAIYTDGSSVGMYDSPLFHPISEHEREYVGAHYVYVGSAPLENRDTYVESISYTQNRDVEAAMKDAIAAHGTHRLPADEVNPVATGILHTLTGKQIPGHVEITRISAALHNVKVRDVVLYDLTGVDQATGHVVNANLRVIAANTPDAFAAPVATTLAINEWLAGDGARANMALDRALGSNRDYTLAQLIHAAVGNGLPPQWWQQTMGRMTRAECATGVTPETPHVEVTNVPQPVTHAHDIAL